MATGPGNTTGRMKGDRNEKCLPSRDGAAVRHDGGVRAQFDIAFLNALIEWCSNANTDPTNANFGMVTSQNNLPRDIQLAAKIVF